MINLADVKNLFEEHINLCDLKKSQETWEKQSLQFRDFWKITYNIVRTLKKTQG